MDAHAPVTALGLMSGTSLDGVDAALLRTDGVGAVEPGPACTVPYDDGLRERLRERLGQRQAPPALVRELTLAHVAAVEALLGQAGLGPGEVAVIGFHGHTLVHRPQDSWTLQIGDGALLAARTGIDVIGQLRAADMAEGGQGAPMVPLYHAALAGPLERPLVVLNLGGVANVTWIGADGAGEGGLLAFDVGPGNALLDDWARRHVGHAYDAEGALAGRGRVDAGALAAMLEHPFFALPPPKSLDRNDFARAAADAMTGLTAEDGAATLVALTAVGAARARGFFPAPVRRWLLSGGGRRNRALVGAIGGAVDEPVAPVEAVGWDGDALEAQAFAYLAVRSMRGLPLSLPTTTGCRRAVTGGTLYRAPAA